MGLAVDIKRETDLKLQVQMEIYFANIFTMFHLFKYIILKL